MRDLRAKGVDWWAKDIYKTIFRWIIKYLNRNWGINKSFKYIFKILNLKPTATMCSDAIERTRGLRRKNDHDISERTQ